MRIRRPVILACSLSAITVFLSVGLANSAGNFLSIPMPKGVSVELPRNWTALSDNQRITLDSWVQAKREIAGASDLSSDLAFAANYYDEQDTIAAMFNIRYYPWQTIAQADARSATAEDIKEFDEGLRAQQPDIQQQFQMRVLSWMGTTKQSINGIVIFVTEYRRAPIREGAPFRVRLVSVLSGTRSFTVTVSYREDQEFLLRPICDRIIQSIRM